MTVWQNSVRRNHLAKTIACDSQLSMPVDFSLDIAFYAVMHDYVSLSTGEAIIFDDIRVNKGNG